MPGQTVLNRYRIERQLGQRLGRLTLLVTDQETQQQLVLKILSFGPQSDWQDYKLFEREASLLKTVRHPAIPQYVDFFDLDLPECRGFALAQTYIDAPSLQEWMQLGRSFSPVEVQQIAQSILEILVYLHGQHPPIIHRDIKPSNILLSDRTGHFVGSVHLVDFGAVQTLVSSGTQTVVGSYGYMPLEQFGGRAVPASDLYSLGSTLVELLMGQHPADLLDEQHQLQIKRIEAPAILVSWLQWLTQPHPQQRPPSAQVALEALSAIPQTDHHSVGEAEWIWHLEQKQWITQSAIRRWQQPEGSQVVLKQLPNYLSLTLPASDKWSVACGLPVLGVFSAVWNSVVIGAFWGGIVNFSVTTLAAFFGALVGLLFILVFGVIGLFIAFAFISAVYNFLFFQKTQVCFYNKHTYWHRHYRFGPWHWRSSRKQSKLEKLVYVPTYFRNDGENGKTKIGAQLEFHLGVKNEFINQGLSELELQWLAQELSERLDIPCEYVQVKESL
ncbi:MAG TPA: serine/threonine-protein kinase [Leptolyngbyaceae cyanobacterium]